jgi:hypothetical protein
MTIGPRNTSKRSKGVNEYLKKRNWYLMNLAPELLPDEDSIPQTFTEEEMELVAEKDL